MHEAGRPVLLEPLVSQNISANLLNQREIPKPAQRQTRERGESNAQAGRKWLTTNMAGRGTDIILGGNAEYMRLKLNTLCPGS